MSFRAFRLAACAAALAATFASPTFAAIPRALSQGDAAIYQAAFAAVRAGDFKTAEKRMRKAEDKSLVGYVEFEKLMHPSAHTATYAELKNWLDKYGDLPGAERVYALAQKRQPDRAAGLDAPAVLSLIRDVAEKGLALVGMPSPAARTAFYNGDPETAYKLAAQSSERWVAGLSAFRLGKFADARSHFDAVARDTSEDEWLRAGAAYWAARSVIADGSPELAPDYLAAAAQKPWTFYGMLAEAQLGLEPSIHFDTSPAPAVVSSVASAADSMSSMLIRVSTAPKAIRVSTPEAPQPAAHDASVGDSADAARLVRNDVRARRAAGLMQLGRMSEAVREIELGLAEATSDDMRRGWSALSQEISVPADAVRSPALGGFDPADYPMPVLQPRDGFTIDPALVYAIVRQESRFNPDAVSHVGAIGLMQIMPETAVLTSGDDSLRRNTRALRDPSLNLRLGQDYFAWLLTHGVGDDLLSAVAAYNSGPGTLLKTQAQLGGNADPLMVMESLPAQETRAYVEKVMAGYWLYRREFGAQTASLAALAGGATKLPANLEQAVKLPGAPALADVTLASTTALDGHN